MARSKSKNVFVFSFPNVWFWQQVFPFQVFGFDNKFSLFQMFGFDNKSFFSIHFETPCSSLHCKKELAVFPSLAGKSLIKLFLGGNNLVFSRPERVWSVTSRLGTGKWLTLFYSVPRIKNSSNPRKYYSFSNNNGTAGGNVKFKCYSG
jgi:hypothetical protein